MPAPGCCASATVRRWRSAHRALLLLDNYRQLARDGDLQLLTHLGLLVPHEVVALCMTGEAILSEDTCFADPHPALLKHERHAPIHRPQVVEVRLQLLQYV